MHPYATTVPQPAATRPEAPPGTPVLPVRTRPGPAIQDTSLMLGYHDTAPADARATLRLTLKTWQLPGLIDLAESITTELVTNAIAVSRDKAPPGTEPRPVILRLTVQPGAGELCIRVWDPDPTAPPSGQLPPGDDEESGRGLFIVNALSSRWGWHPGPNGGKFVWSALSLDVQPPPD